MEKREQINRILSDTSWTLLILFLGFFAWLFNADLYLLPIISLFLFATLLLCDDIRNVFSFIIAVPTLINHFDSNNFFSIASIIGSLTIVLLGIIIYIIKQLKRYPTTNLGIMFFPMIIFLFVHLFGGIYYHLNLISFFLIIFFSLFLYFVYWASINFCHDLRRYFRELFISLGILLFLQLFVSYLKIEEPFWECILKRSFTEIGLQNINSVGFYFVIAMIASFDLGFKQKKDYLYTILAGFFLICTYFTYSRASLIVGLIIFIIATLITFIKSKNRKIYIFLSLGVLLLIYLLIVFQFDAVNKILNWYLQMGTNGNGREILWPWCWEQFLKNPIFGIGFHTPEIVPTIQTPHFVMAHNTILQYLTSTGVVGTTLMIYVFIMKYYTSCHNFKLNKIFPILLIISIDLWGITQTPVVSPFFLMITILAVALLETVDFRFNKLHNFNYKLNKLSHKHYVIKIKTKKQRNTEKTIVNKLEQKIINKQKKYDKKISDKLNKEQIRQEKIKKHKELKIQKQQERKEQKLINKENKKQLKIQQKEEAKLLKIQKQAEQKKKKEELNKQKDLIKQENKKQQESKASIGSENTEKSGEFTAISNEVDNLPLKEETSAITPKTKQKEYDDKKTKPKNTRTNTKKSSTTKRATTTKKNTSKKKSNSTSTKKKSTTPSKSLKQAQKPKTKEVLNVVKHDIKVETNINNDNSNNE